MSIIVKRATKGSGLTSSEIDANVNNLNNDKVEINNPNFKSAPSLVNNLIPLTGTVLPAIYPSLNLDFANGKQLDPRITFSRNTVATYYDGQTTAMAEQNLLLQSQFVASWAALNSTLTANSVVAPDGATTAATLIPTGGVSGAHGVVQSAGVIGNQYTYSVYGKSNGYTNLQLYADSSGNFNATFDLTAGTAASTGGATVSIVSIGSGWYRCIATFTQASSTRLNVQGFPTGATASNFGNSFTGDGVSGISIWGAQLEQRSSVTAYTPTTSSPITNYIPVLKTAASNVPRIDYDPITKKCLGLLIEELRTNSLLNSTIDGANLATQNITTTAVARTLSFYGTGKVVLSGTATATITGLGAYPKRTTYTYTPTAGTLTLTVSGTVQYANDEVGAFATSYIPTAGTEKSRTADNASMTGVNFSSWYNQSQGTMYVEWDYNNAAAKNLNVVPVGMGASGNNRWMMQSGSVPIGLQKGAVYVLNSPTFGLTQAVFLNGVAGGLYGANYADTTPINNLRLGSAGSFALPLTGHIRKLTYYPKALTAVELQGLTS